MPSIPSSDFLHPNRHLIRRRTSPRDQFRPAGIALVPERQAPLAQEILVVQAQFFKTRPRNICKLEFGLFRRTARLASLCDVLHSAPCGLDHLTMSSTSFLHVSVAEADRDVVHELSNLKALQLAIAAVLGDKRGRGSHGSPKNILRRCYLPFVPNCS